MLSSGFSGKGGGMGRRKVVLANGCHYHVFNKSIAGFEIFRNGYAEQIRGILYRFYCTHNTKNTDAQSTYPSPNDLSMNFKYLFFYHFYHFLEPRHSSNMYKQSDRNTRGPGGLKLTRRTGSVAAGYEMHYR